MVDFLINHYKEMSNTALAGHLGISLSCYAESCMS